MRAGFPIGRILGIGIRLHLSWIFVVALVVVFMGDSELPGAPLLDLPLRWAAGIAIALLFFVSVLAHELAHALVARRWGLPVEELTLYVFGGSMTVDRQPPRPRAEAEIALAGPLLSLAVGAALFAGWWLTTMVQGPLSSAAGWVALWVAMANVLLGGLNLAPGLPMDGGRIVRAAVWARTGDYVRGSRSAAASGRTIGLAIIAGGLAVAALGDVAIGLWLTITGWFLRQAAGLSYRRAEVGRLVEGVRVGELMDADVAVIGPNLTLDTLLDQHSMSGGVGLYPVTVDGALVGTVEVSRLRRVPRAEWSMTRVTEVMTVPDDAAALTVETAAMEALMRFERSRASAFPVVDKGNRRLLRGILTRDRLIEALQRRAALGAGLGSE